MAGAEPLRRRGVELTLASPPGGELQRRWTAMGFAHLPWDMLEHAGLRRGDGHRRPSPRQLAGELLTTARTVRQLATLAARFDVVHSTNLWAHLDAALGARLARRPAVLELCDIVRPGPGRDVLTAAALASSSVVAISRAVASCVRPPVRNRVAVVPVAVDVQRFHPGPADPQVRARLADEPDAPLVGMVGRVDPEKGVDVVVRALALLRGEAARAHLVIVGAPGLDDGEYAAEVRAAAAPLGGRVRFAGYVPDPAEVIRSFDVLVNASRAEPFGMAVLEAQASGVPVIASAAGGIPEFVEHDASGLLVPPGDVGALAAALQRLLGDVALQRRLRQHALDQVRRCYDIGQRADRLAAIYRRLGER